MIRHWMVFVTAAIAMSACTEQPAEPQVYNPYRSAASILRPFTRPTLDDRFATIARDVPGFSGWWIEDGVAVVGMVNPGDSASIRPHIEKWISASMTARHQLGSLPKFRYERARYDFAQLKHYYDEITPAIWELPNVTSTDIAESKNRLVVGVSSESVGTLVRELLVDRGVPTDAFTVVVERPEQELALITDSIRPIIAGLRVASRTLTAGCTLGWVFRYSGSSTTYYTTASHCTATRGTVDTTRWFSPWYSTVAAGIATEYDEADWFWCSGGLKCTYADMVILGPATSGEYSFGRLARTTYSQNNGTSGSLTLDPSYPNGWEIVGTEDFPVEGTYGNKVGVSTGWTNGQIYHTCLDIAGTHPWLMKCSYRSYGHDDGGDSGAPVFYVDGNNTVVAMGVLWGRPGPGAFTFQTTYGMETAVGTFNLY